MFKAQGDEPVVNPKWWRVKLFHAHENVILFFDPDYLQRFVDQAGYDPGKVKRLKHQRYYPPSQKGMPAAAGPAIGAPVAASLLEVLAVLGAKRILGFGLCGSIHKDLAIGELYLPDTALSEEGTSQHYLPGEDRFATSASLRESVAAQLTDKKIRARTGPIWTTDAFFRETADKVTAYGQRGILAVDMETSALCAVARYRQVQYAALLAVSDELAGLIWKPGFKFAALKKALGQAMKFLETLQFATQA